MIATRDRNTTQGYTPNATTIKVDEALSSTSNNPPSNKAVTNAINPLRDYSDNETVIGSLNGKPIYRKYIDLKNQEPTNVIVAQDIDVLVHNELWFQDTSLPENGLAPQGTWFPVGGYVGIISYVTFGHMSWISPTGDFVFEIDGKSGVLNIRGVIEYTKLSD